MKITSLASVEHLPGSPGLFANLGRLDKADLEPKRTAYFEDHDPEVIIADWMKILNDNGDAMSSELIKLELSEEAKIGPFLRSRYSDYADDMHAYFDVPKLDLSLVAEIMSHPAVEAVSQFRLKSTGGLIVPTNVTEALKNARRGTNLGLPLFTSNWTSENLRSYVGRAASFMRGSDAPLYPFVLFHRSQPRSRTEWKDRIVWGSDHSETFIGLCFLKPLLDKLVKLEEYSAWKGIDVVENSLRRSLIASRGALSLDFSGFDKTISPTLMCVGINLISDMVDPGHKETLLRLGSHYSSGSIVTPEGVISGDHGMPSGVALTNLIDTVVNHAITSIALWEIGRYNDTIGRGSVSFHGDDAVIFGVDRFEESELAALSRVYKRYGLVLSTDKTGVSSTSCHYLQRIWTNQESAVMSTMRVLGRLLYTERRLGLGRFMDTGEYGDIASDSVRRDVEALVGVMKIENCKNHPLFPQFVAFIAKYNPALLKLDRIDKSSRVIDEARGYKYISAIPERTGIRSFATWRMLSLMH